MFELAQNAYRELNAEQQVAASALSHALVTACPGSGKTKTLAVKAALLLQEPTHRVCIVTFTKDAADELKERAVALTGDDKAAKSRLIAGTFHALCFKMLRTLRPIELRAILKPGETLQYAQRSAAALGLEIEGIDAMAMIERARTADPFVVTDLDRRLSAEYKKLLRRNQKHDFTDLVEQTIDGLKLGTIAPLAISHLLVDEYQDTDESQYLWVKAHSAKGTRVTVVGDDDQSIFSWRQALGYDGMMRFAEEHGAASVVLSTNYRCKKNILEAAEHLISKNNSRVAKQLHAHRDQIGEIKAIQYKSSSEEAAAVALRLADFETSTYTAAVIARTNRALLATQAALESIGIPVSAPGSASILESEEAGVFFDLCDFVGKDQRRGLEHALSWANVHPSDLAKLSAQFDGSLDPFDSKRLDGLELDPRSRASWRDFAGKFARLRLLAQRSPQPTSAIVELIEDWIRVSGSVRAGTLRDETISLIAGFLNSRTGNLDKRVDGLRQYRKDKRETPERAVILTTMHAAKGLEWNRVFVVRAEEDVCPSARSINIEEERRLFYVAMTRARDALFLSTSGGVPSRFLVEARLALQVPVTAIRPAY